MILAILIGATLIFALGAGWRHRACWATGSVADRVVTLLAVPAFFMTLLIEAHAIVTPLWDRWSWVRLAPSVAILRGYALYYPEGVGPLLGWSYGPLVPLLHLPAAALPGPVAAVVAGAIMNVILLQLPLALLVGWALPASPRKLPQGVILFSAALAVMLHCAPSRYWLARIQVDSFALGFSLLGLLLLLEARAGEPVSRGRILSAGCLFGAAALCKQNELFLMVVPLGYLGWRDGRSRMLLLALAGAAVVGAGLALTVAAWGWDAVFLNLWLVPARHPWSMESLPDGFCTMGLLFFSETKWVLLFFVALVGLDLKAGAPEPSSRAWLGSRPWVFVALAGAVLLPISVLGRLKIGGDDNSYHPLYFVLGATAILLCRLLREDRPKPLRWAVPVFAFGVSLAALVLSSIRPQSLDQQGLDSDLKRDYAFSRAHPEEVYYSADPLVTLFTDRKLYHQGFGVFDRRLARLPPSNPQLMAHVPARMRWVSTPGVPWWVPAPLVGIRRPPGFNTDLWSEWKGPAR